MEEQPRRSQRLRTMAVVGSCSGSMRHNLVDGDPFDDAIHLVMKVKRRFRNEPLKYTTFLDVLHTYQSGNLGLREVCDKVFSLVSEHPDLLEGFVYFLPDVMQSQATSQMQEMKNRGQLYRQPEQKGDANFGLCVVCQEAPRSEAFVPCGHLSVCHSCASRCMERSGCCPICNQKATRVMRVYLS